MTTYVALGSSFAAGPGIDPIVHPGCGRSGRNYASLVAERLGFDLVDITSGGATVDDVLSRPQALLTGGSVPPQLDALVPDADLVTVTVGGNDVDYLLTLLRCSYRADPAGAPAAAGAFFGTPIDAAAVDTALDALPARLAGLVTAVRERAPRARVVLVDYLTVVPDSATAAFPMSEEHRRLCAGIGRRLEEATAAAARDTGADLVPASRISRDHAVGADQPWVTGWVFGDLLAGGVGPYHPNAAGMRAVADLLVEHLTHGPVSSGTQVPGNH
jgi:lysophospholipase L1-like esterase